MNTEGLISGIGIGIAIDGLEVARENVQKKQNFEG